MNTSVWKLCAEFLRNSYNIKPTHAHELVAAFFGYKSHAAQLSEQRFKVENIGDAELLIPAIGRIEDRRHRLEGLPVSLPESKAIAQELVRFLKDNDLFEGEAWIVDDLGTFLMEEYLPENVALDVELSAEIASTNAIFEDVYYESADIQDTEGSLLVSVQGLYSGETRDERPYAGDQIDFVVKVEFPRVSGRTGFLWPEVTAGGSVRDWRDDESDAEMYISVANHNNPNSVGRKRKASPVDGHKIPKWIEGVLKKEYPYARLRKSPQEKRRALENLFEGIRLDHWGTTEWEGVKHCFVTEPYGVDQARVAKLKEKGRRLGFAVVYDPIAYHNPGGCERVLIFPTELSPTLKYKPLVLEALREAGCHVENNSVRQPEMQILEERKGDRQAFEKSILAFGRSPHDFFDRIVAVERIGEEFIFRCLRGNESRLQTALKRSKKWAKETGHTHPLVKVAPITDQQLISAGDGLYVCNDGFYIGAFEQKCIPTKFIERVEKLFTSKLEGHLRSSLRSPANEFDEQHLLIELMQPITAKAFRELYTQLKPELEKIPDAGYCGVMNLRKTSSWQSVSDFMKDALEQSRSDEDVYQTI